MKVIVMDLCSNSKKKKNINLSIFGVSHYQLVKNTMDL